jgi:CMP/dCMP kinase
MKGLVVSLDGPGSSGKSSVGAAAALELGYRFLDTGVLYRALARLAVDRGIDPEDESALVGLVPEVELQPDEHGRLRRVRVHGTDITDRLHAPEVDQLVSAVSRHAEVRRELLATQRALARSGRVILAGRDIGTVVLPHADLKLYLDVSLDERARRRAADRDASPGSPQEAAIREDLRRRDLLDSTRAVAPLRRPDGAVVVRSDGRRFEETVAEVVRVIRAHEGRPRPMQLALGTRLIAWLCRVGLRAIARIRVEGLQHLPREGPLIIAANHMSNVDPPLVGGWLGPALGRRPVFLAKASLFRGPLALFFRALGAVPVKAGGNDVDAYRAARAVLGAGEVISIMPEGTRSLDGVLGRPKAGVSMLAARTGAAVVPVGISGTDRLLGRGARLPRIGSVVSLRVGTPFHVAIPPGADRRAALGVADEELMRRIARLVEPRHRGAWEPWPDE